MFDYIVLEFYVCVFVVHKVKHKERSNVRKTCNGFVRL